MEEITPGKNAIIELGKKLLIESIETSRRYSEFMVLLSIKAIPVYLGLIVFMKKDEAFFEDSSFMDKIIFVLPVIFFLISMLVFILVFNPKKNDVNLDNLSDLKRAIKNISNQRDKWNRIATIFFVVGVLVSIYVLFQIMYSGHGE